MAEQHRMCAPQVTNSVQPLSNLNSSLSLSRHGCCLFALVQPDLSKCKIRSMLDRPRMIENLRLAWTCKETRLFASFVLPTNTATHRYQQYRRWRRSMPTKRQICQKLKSRWLSDASNMHRHIGICSKRSSLLHSD